MVASLVDEANLKAGESGLESIREELRSLAPHLLEKQVKERRQGLPELPETDAEEVILRFAPNPNGPLSFGHSRGVVINSEYVKSLGGKLILRFDDTDTVRKPPLPESYSMIEQEVRWLTEIEPVVVIASDRIEIYHQHALELLRMNGAYVCLCSADEFKQHRLDMSECPHRDADIEINLGLWKQMNDGRLKAGDAVVRVRTEMSLPNPQNTGYRY
jgi:glutamyl-tRNA synthetase